MDIFNALTILPRDVQKMLHAKLTEMLSRGGAQPCAQSDDIQLVHDQVTEVLKLYGNKNNMPFSVAKKQKFFTAVVNDGKLLVDYVDLHLKPVDRATRALCVFIVLRLIARNLKRQGIPVSYRTIAYQMKHVGEVFDYQFPGYCESGLLPIVIKKYTDRKQKI